MCTLHLIKPAMDVNSAGSLNVNMVKLTSGWYYKMYNIATNVDLHITIHNDKANSLILLPFISIHLSCKLMVWVDVGLSSNNSQFIKCNSASRWTGQICHIIHTRLRRYHWIRHDIRMHEYRLSYSLCWDDEINNSRWSILT